MNQNVYWGLGALLGVPVFVIGWIYCVAHYGFIIGVLVGWLPSLIVAFIVAALWPVIAIAAAWAFLHH